MKFFHLSDLHIGKQLNGYNLKEDQIYILDKIVEKAINLKPDAILISGDIYDKSIPSAEAVSIFDRFLTSLCDISDKMAIMIISGNHDSAERLDYASEIFKKNNIYIAGLPPQNNDEYLKKVVLNDEYGEVNFYLLPFIKPGNVRHLFDYEIKNYDDALKMMLARENIDYSKRNVLLAHQFFTYNETKPQTCDSETLILSQGGIENVDVSNVKDFDYVALGHIHGPQRIGFDHIRYSGTLLKYSVSERNHNKCLNIVNLNEKGSDIQIEKHDIKPLRDLKLVEGYIDEIISMASEIGVDNYLSIVLKNEEPLYKPKDKLETIFNNILEVKISKINDYKSEGFGNESIDLQNPFEIFEKFFSNMQGRELNEKEKAVIEEIIQDDGGNN